MKRLARLSLLVFSFFALVAARPAQALTLGDAALTVSVTTLTGAVLGLSTLPFYEDSSEHTKNIYYGAAIGAVTGVLLAAYSGVQDGKSGEEEEEASLLHRGPADARFAFSRQIIPERLSGKSAPSFGPRGVLVWSPLASMKF